MSSLRGLKPTTGLTVLLGTGFSVVCFGYFESDARQGLASRAAKTRKQVLLAALSKRLQQQAQRPRLDLPRKSTADEFLPTHRAAAMDLSSSTLVSSNCFTEDGSFYVVTGPDIHLTTIARDRVCRTLQLQRSTNMSTAPPARHPSLAYLVVPYDCVIGTGHLSSLVEKQLLSKQAPPEIHGESEQLHRSTTLRTSSAVIDKDLRDEEILSSLERLLLRATRWIMDPEELDNVALWALEGALTPASPSAASEETLPTSVNRSTSSPWTTVRAEGPAVDGKGNKITATERGEEIAQVLATPEERSDSQAAEMGSVCSGANSFVLEIVTRAYRDQESFEKQNNEDGERMDSPTIGGAIFRWGWHLANRGLANVIVSSSNPWILAELRQALNTESEELVSSSVEGGGDSGRFTSFKGVGIDAGVPREVILVRVALPSAVEREQAVTSVAEELEVGHRLSARDVSTLADLTGGRRGPLLDVLARLQASPSSAKVDGICQAAVDDQALALARCWGLLSPVENSERSSGEIKLQDNKRKGKEQRRQWEDDRVALWEALHVLSAPVVSVGTAASASTRPPEGNMPPSELLRACELDPATLLRLTRQGWMEVSPAGSGVVLPDPETIPDSSTASLTQYSSELQTATRSSQARSPPPDVRAFVEKVPVESLDRLLHRSFVGATPLHLAAFRRLVDSVTPLSKTQGIGDGLNGLVVVREGEGNGQAGSGDYADAWRSGQLERAGCLIEASVLRRQAEREDERLTEDGEKLSYYWSELASVRQDLQRQGRGDASEGEWAEVQLELIRQERAVVAEAQEMRTRRSRVKSTRDKIQGLGRRARSVPPSLLPRQEDTALPLIDSMISLTTSSEVEGEQWRVSLPEEGVLRDAEGGVRLMPLRESSLESSMSVDGDEGMDRGQPVSKVARDRSVWTWGYGQRLWRWLRGE